MRDDVGVTASDVRQHHGDELARMSALEYDRYMRQRTAFWARHDIERHSGRADRTEKGKPTSSVSANVGAQRSAEGVGRSAAAAGVYGRDEHTMLALATRDLEIEERRSWSEQELQSVRLQSPSVGRGSPFDG